jgi:putative ABC transport system substrate-binding protein
MMNKNKQPIGYWKNIAGVIVTLLVAGPFLLGSCTSGDGDSLHFNIGLVTNNPNGLRNIQGFKDGMADLGYIEGENVSYVFDGSPVNGDRLDAVLESMVESKVDLIFTAGTPTGIAAQRVTDGTNIPIVFGVIADPVAAGIMTDLTKPGGNMTGVKLDDNQARRLELLLEITPDIKRIFFPYNPEDAASSSAVEQIDTLAPDLGVEIVRSEAYNDSDVTKLLNNIPQNVDAIFLVPGTTVNQRLQELLSVALVRRLPVSGPSTAQVEEGALTAYGFIHYEAGKQAARIADQVLKGVDPGNIPVETAESFLAVNLQTAEAVGIEIPYEILQQAEIIIRADKKK